MGGGGCVLSGRGPWGRRRVAPSPVFPTVSTILSIYYIIIKMLTQITFQILILMKLKY